MPGVVEFIIKMQDGLSGPLGKVAVTSASAKGALAKLTESNKQLKSMMAESGQAVSKFDGQLRNLISNPLAVLSGTAIGAGIIGIINKGLRENSDSLDFRVLLGDKQGTQLYDSLKDLKPILGDSVQQVAKDLLNVGYASDKVKPLIEQLGAVSRGDASKFNMLSMAFAEIRKEGKLTDSTLAALNDSGFKPLTHISERFGIKMEKVQQMLADGKIDLNLVTKALDDATGAGGEFEGVLSKLAGEPTTMWAIMTSKIDGMVTKLGGSLLPIGNVVLSVVSAGVDYLGAAVDRTANFFSVLFDWGSRNSDMLTALAGAVLGGVAAYKAYQGWQVLSYAWMMRDTIATTVLTGAKGLLTVVTGGLTVAQGALNAVFLESPIGWIVGGIALVTGAIILAWEKFEGFRKVVYGVWESVKTIFGNIAKFFGKLFGMNVGEYEDVGKAWGRGVAQGAESWKESQSNKGTAKHFGATGGNSALEKILQKQDKASGNGGAQAGLNAVSGGGVRNITITVGKMIEKLEVRVVGGTQQMAQEIERIAEEVMVRAIASAAGRG